MIQSNAYGPAPGNHDPTPGTVREEASNVGNTAAEAGSRVAHTAADQGRQVAAETGRQARNLIGQASGQVREQAAVQQQRAAGALRSFATDLHSMSGNATQSAVSGDLVRQAADRAHRVADWLEQRDPAAVLHEVRGYARRHPGVFLAGAAVAGVVAGRLGRGLAAGGHLSGGTPSQNGRRSSGYPVGATTPDDMTARGTANPTTVLPNAYPPPGASQSTPGASPSTPGASQSTPGDYGPGTPDQYGSDRYHSAAPGQHGITGPGEPAGYLAGDLPVDEPVPGTGNGTTYRSEAGRS